jgi:hypothetical protein
LHNNVESPALFLKIQYRKFNKQFDRHLFLQAKVEALRQENQMVENKIQQMENQLDFFKGKFSSFLRYVVTNSD